MAVLASLGGGHLDDLAGSPFQQHEAVLAQRGALHGVGGGCPGITCLEVQIRVRHVCCVEVNGTKATFTGATPGKVLVLRTTKTRTSSSLDVNIGG